ncbi:hypothetical protein D3C71_1235390 [compost metagenome]
MAGGTAAHSGETQHLVGIQGSGLRRCQLFGNQNRLVRQLPDTVRHPENQLEHALADIHQVQRPLGQQGVAQRLEQRSGGFSSTVPGKRRALALVNQGLGLLQQTRVFQ